MKGQGSYVPPLYIPLHQSDTEADSTPLNDSCSSHRSATQDPTQWSSGICACFDDMQSCMLLSALCSLIFRRKRIQGCIGVVCPCVLFGKNAEFLSSGTLAGSCMTHCILWCLASSVCCLFTGGLLAGLPGSMVACYACGYRKQLRAKYDLQEAPCGDLATHLFCHTPVPFVKSTDRFARD